jgi:hypothetical protein
MTSATAVTPKRSSLYFLHVLLLLLTIIIPPTKVLFN